MKICKAILILKIGIDGILLKITETPDRIIRPCADIAMMPSFHPYVRSSNLLLVGLVKVVSFGNKSVILIDQYIVQYTEIFLVLFLSHCSLEWITTSFSNMVVQVSHGLL